LMGEASQVITGGRCALPETLMREGFQFQYPDILTFFNKAFSVSS
ncbi:MAG TPA: epimerase, partial [Akkermansia sp.]|nr:epimerase [Akkermansia sp.]